MSLSHLIYEQLSQKVKETTANGFVTEDFGGF